MSINSVALCGNLTRDPEVKEFASGSKVINFSMAVNESVKKDGEWTDRANYFDVQLWGNRADWLGKNLTKGSKVMVSGRLRWEQYEKNGEKRSIVRVIADDVEVFLPKKNEEDTTAVYEEDIPF